MDHQIALGYRLEFTRVIGMCATAKRSNIGASALAVAGLVEQGQNRYRVLCEFPSLSTIAVVYTCSEPRHIRPQRG